MVHTLNVIRSALVDLLILGAILLVALVLVMAWRASRRHQLVVTELINSTGHSDLDGVTRGLTQLARQRIDTELRVVDERREFLFNLLRGAAHHGIDHTSSGGRTNRALERVQERFDDRMQQLLAATPEVAPKQAQPAVQFLTVLVSRPRGLMVSGILQCRGTAGPRWGVSFDVLRVDTNRSVASQTFWEPPTPAASGDTEQAHSVSRPVDAAVTHERILALLPPAGRWLAIQLVIQSVFRDGVRDDEKGLDRLLRGMLYAQSIYKGFEGFGNDFWQLALADLRDAAVALYKVEVRNPMRLAALADTLDKLAPFAKDATARAETYRKAHTLYNHTLDAMAASSTPADVIQRYHIRQAISWLASALPEQQRKALRWLDEGGPDLPKLPPADDLYNAACLYALAARDRSHRRLGANAARLLTRALALYAGEPDRKLWAQAQSDDQLTGVPVAALETALETALISSAQPATQLPQDKLDSIADQVLTSTGTP
jgi:hypothetical protein